MYAFMPVGRTADINRNRLGTACHETRRSSHWYYSTVRPFCTNGIEGNLSDELMHNGCSNCGFAYSTWAHNGYIW